MTGVITDEEIQKYLLTANGLNESSSNGLSPREGPTKPAVHRARTDAPLPKIEILSPYHPKIATLPTKLLLLLLDG